MNLSFENSMFLLGGFVFAVISYVVKRSYLDKKYSEEKSKLIYAVLNALLIPMFIYIGEYYLTFFWFLIFMNNIPRKKSKNESTDNKKDVSNS